MADLTPKPKVQVTPVPTVTPSATSTPAIGDSEPRVKRKYTKRAPLIHDWDDRRNSTPISEDSLPTRLISSKPLPTTLQKSATNLSSEQYQSVADSAVLAASLHRSRVQWLCDGIFKRYWIKPSKRKGAPDVGADNPDQKSMHKLGACTISVGPHTFEAVVYTVREKQLPPPPPFPRPPLQHLSLPPQSNAFQPSPASVQPHSSPSNAPFVTSNQQPATPLSTVNQETNGSRASASTSASVPPKRNGSDHPTIPKPGTDPVIQMLAARAATDIHLKELMKVVATSKATHEQLKEFQSHIDEFNAIIKKDQDRAQKQTSKATPPQPPQLDVVTDNHTQNIARPTNPPALSAAHPSAYRSPGPPPAAGTPVPNLAASPAYAYYPPAKVEPFIKHIVLELLSPATSTQLASQDRWLFPEYAVLDTPATGRGLEMVCSFFVERRGSEIIATQGGQSGDDTGTTGSTWQPDVEYYQSVTMILRASQHRTLETIARAAQPLPKVHEYMAEVMKKKTRAPLVYLSLQLPRDVQDVQMPANEFEDSAIEIGEDDELKEYYGH